jgi:hypothetical protein
MYFNPFKIFLPIATVVFVAFVLSASVDIFVFFDMTEKTLILFLAFVQITILGLLADLIDKRNA